MDVVPYRVKRHPFHYARVTPTTTCSTLPLPNTPRQNHYQIIDGSYFRPQTNFSFSLQN